MEWKEKLFYSWFLCVSSILVEWEFENVGFSGGRKTRVPGEKPLEQGENQQQTQRTCTCMTLGWNQTRLHQEQASTLSTLPILLPNFQTLDPCVDLPLFLPYD